MMMILKSNLVIAKYSSAIRSIHFIKNKFHFIVPFIINIIQLFDNYYQCTTTSISKNQQNYQEILKEQFQQYKQL